MLVSGDVDGVVKVTMSCHPSLDVLFCSGRFAVVCRNVEFVAVHGFNCLCVCSQTWDLRKCTDSLMTAHYNGAILDLQANRAFCVVRKTPLPQVSQHVLQSHPRGHGTTPYFAQGFAVFL